MTKKEIIGKAYGFFDCSASKQEIEKTLPSIREAVATPAKLELSLIEDVENLKGPNKLTSIAQEAKESGLKYVLEASYIGATNRQTADELSAVLNQAYQSPLYKNKEEFRGAIVYKEIGEFIFRE